MSEVSKLPKLVRHHGIFRFEISELQATALIVSGTIGAGILGLPYALSQVGVPLGLLSLIIVGFFMMGINLLVGRLAENSGKPLQLVGLAKHYLGRTGEVLMACIVYATLAGVLTIYLIGVGEALSALFSGDPILWSIGFFAIGSLLVFLGLRVVKAADIFLSLGVLLLVTLLSLVSVPHISVEHIAASNISAFFVPYGILIFAFHGTTSVPEAHSLLPKAWPLFRRAVVRAGVIIIAAYALFSTAIIAVTGPLTTEIATIGLGERVGPIVFLFGNLFALLAMGTGFLIAALSLRDSLVWDMKIKTSLASLVVCGVPFLLFIFGLRQFTEAIDLVGGVFMTIEIGLILLMGLVMMVQKKRNQRFVQSGK